MKQKQPKLVRLLHCIEDEKEWKKLERFFNQLNANKKKRVITVVRYIKKTIPHLTSAESLITYDRERLSKILLGKNDIAQLSNFLAHITKLVEQFLILQSLESNELKFQEKFSELYYKRKQNQDFLKSLDKEERLLSLTENRDIWYFLKKFELNHNRYFNPFYIKKNQKNTVEDIIGEERYDKALFNTFNALDHFILLSKLKMACELANRRGTNVEDIDNLLIDEILETIRNKYLDIPTFNIYYKIYDCFKSKVNTISTLVGLKNLFYANQQKFSLSDQDTLYNFIISLTIKEVNRNLNSDYILFLFELYKEGMKKDCLYNNGAIPPLAFINICNLATHLQEGDWLLQFINKYENYLPLTERSSCVNLAKVMQINVSNLPNKWQIMIDYIKNIKPHYSTYKTKIYFYEIIAYFEEEFLKNKNITTVLEICNTFYLYLKENRTMSTDLKERYFKYINGVKFLMQGNSEVDLVAYFEEQTNLYGKIWLINKAKSLVDKKIPSLSF